MAKQIKLAAQPRAGLGRSAVTKLKAQGLVPAVIYGAKQAPEHLQFNAREIDTVLSHATGEHFLVEIEVSGAKSRLALVQEVQHHPVTRKVLHVDLHAVAADEILHAAVPVETIGEAAGVKTGGGLLELQLHSLEVACLPKDLPEVIRLDVSALNIGDAIHIRDVQLPAGVTARADGELTVVRVAPPTVVVEPTPAAAAAAPGAAAQPEVLKEKKAEETK
jgi:large subunit ribosomal protein L25